MKNQKLILAVAIVVLAFAGGWLWAGRDTVATAQAPSVSLPAAVQNSDASQIVMYQNPACGCCSKWAAHMEEAGFEVEVHKTAELNAIKAQHGIDATTAACHTAMVDGYIVEGHVPVREVIRMLEERPDVVGITVPGMPLGSPGMEADRTQPYDVLTFDAEGNTEVYASY